jgi:quaternary ammonium compound-resistance protein SugE
MAWLVLLVAGGLEPVWANALSALSRKDGRRVGNVLLFLTASAASLACLVFAMGRLPTGTSYAVWVGLGSALTVGWSMLRGYEPASPVRVVCLVGIIASIAGLTALS